MKLQHLPSFFLCFYLMTIANLVNTECDEEDVYCEEEEVEEITNDYCYSKEFQCETVQGLSDCDLSIESLCGLIQSMFYSQEPMVLTVENPLKANVSIRGICHACRFGETSNIYKDETFRTLAFGLKLPFLHILADVTLKLGFFEKKMTVLANCTNFNVRLAVDVCDKNISHSKMKECKIDQSSDPKPDCLLGVVDNGNVNVIPPLVKGAIMGFVLALIPTVMPTVMNKDIGMVGMIGGCPMTGGPE